MDTKWPYRPDIEPFFGERDDSCHYDVLIRGFIVIVSLLIIYWCVRDFLEPNQPATYIGESF